MFRVITVAREFGSGGGAIARRAAERLGWKLLDDDFVEAVARAAQVDVATARRYDESVDSCWHRINRAGLSSAALYAGAAPADAQFFDAETMAAFAHGIILDSAAKGNCVIVGRGAQCVLRNCPEALHVFVYAPLFERIQRVQARLGKNDVEQLVRSTDRMRAGHIYKYFGWNWKDRDLYQLMVSSALGCENVARTIVDVVENAELAALLESVAV